MTMEQRWWLRCDRDNEDGIWCSSVGGPSPDAAEEMGRLNGWLSGDGYHECPRHTTKENR